MSDDDFLSSDGDSLSSDDFTSEESSEHDELEKGEIDFEKDIQYSLIYCRIIEKLKFLNTNFEVGDDIALRLDQSGKKVVFGKILLIGKTARIVFPIIYVAWYYSKLEGFTNEPYPHLSDQELVLTDQKEWQYAESIMRKINVLTLDDYEELDPLEKNESGTFFRRSYYQCSSGNPAPSPEAVCHCMRMYNPDNAVLECLFCHSEFCWACVKNHLLCFECQQMTVIQVN